jgi:alpha-tubulin suppressor-like RCC1 family protein
MSPEQIEDGEITPASDVWSVAVMAYEWIAGSRPFMRERIGEEVAAILAGPPAPLISVDRRCSSELSTLIDRCLDRDPSARPRDAALLQRICDDQIDWVEPTELAAQLEELAASPESHLEGVSSIRARQLGEMAAELITAGESFAALKLLDRALAYRPNDEALLRQVDEAATLGVGAGEVAQQTLSARMSTLLEHRASGSPETPGQQVVEKTREAVGTSRESWRRGMIIAAVVIVAVAALFVILMTASFVSCAMACRDCASARQTTSPTAVFDPWPPPPTKEQLSASLAARQVSTGRNHACAVVEDGSVRCWGSNQHGQLGDGTKRPSPTPVAVDGLSGVAEVGVGDLFSCARGTDGTVSCWGDGSSGQLGDRDESPAETARPVLGLPRVERLSVGSAHSCAVIDDGTVMCWGEGLFGQCGPGEGIHRPVPRRIDLLSVVVDVRAGRRHSCALLRAGGVQCWGSNAEGRLGFGGRFSHSEPVAVAGVTRARALAVGADHSCILLADGALRCWGEGRGGQLGGEESSSRPLSIPLRGARSVVAGGSSTCALLEEGTARCWGSNEHNLLGVGQQLEVLTPLVMPISTRSRVRQIALGGTYTCVLGEGRSYPSCWGLLGPGLRGERPVVFAHSPTGVVLPPSTSEAVRDVFDADTR